MKGEVKYEMTKIGIVPEDWEVRFLGDAGTFTNGINKHKRDFGHGVPLVNLQDVFGVSVVPYTLQSRVNATEAECQRYNLQQGDVLFVRSSVKPEGVGLTATVVSVPPKTVFSGFLIRFRPLGSLFQLSYLKHCFYEQGFRRRLLACSTVSANTNINQDTLSKLHVRIPPIAEQSYIGDILDCWDLLIFETEKLLSAKQRLRKVLMQQLLTGKWRFKEFKGQPWTKITLKEFLVPQVRCVPKPSQPFLSIGIRSHGKGVFHKPNFDPAKIALEELYQVNVDDLIVNITFAWEGAIAIASKSDDGALVSHRFPTYEFDRKLVIPEYFRHVILQKRFVYELGLVSPGGAGRNRVLSKKDFLKIKVTIPPLEEQYKIAAVLNSLDKEIDLLQQQLGLFKGQKRGLMQKLLTGKIRVKIE